ncbi:unnamed protein product [Gordionus sp. m RMFG-2023]|uniref:BTG family protein-like n=1 Tax=Gordionus sp. m RMFG-2023 TaxID=3053472 RepID=UPI0030E270EF
MLSEIQIALEFLISFLHNKLPRYKVLKFSEKLQNRLISRFDGHWYPENSSKGSAFRCITIGNSKIDEVVREAALDADIDINTLKSAFSCDLSVWVDPNEVSYRTGENGSIKILYNLNNFTPLPTISYNQNKFYNPSTHYYNDTHGQQSTGSDNFSPFSDSVLISSSNQEQANTFYNIYDSPNYFDETTLNYFDNDNDETYVYDKPDFISNNKQHEKQNISPNSMLNLSITSHFTSNYTEPTLSYINNYSPEYNDISNHSRPPTASPTYLFKNQYNYNFSKDHSFSNSGSQYIALTPPPSFPHQYPSNTHFNQPNNSHFNKLNYKFMSTSSKYQYQSQNYRKKMGNNSINFYKGTSSPYYQQFPINPKLNSNTSNSSMGNIRRGLNFSPNQTQSIYPASNFVNEENFNVATELYESPLNSNTYKNENYQIPLSEDNLHAIENDYNGEFYRNSNFLNNMNSPYNEKDNQTCNFLPLNVMSEKVNTFNTTTSTDNNLLNNIDVMTNNLQHLLVAN